MYKNPCGDGCKPGYIAGRPTPKSVSGCTLNPCPVFKTYVIPKNLGTDETDQPYAPKLGTWTNAIVVYEANGAEYLYDNEGVFTKIGGTGLGQSGVSSVNGETGDVVLSALIVQANGQEMARYNGEHPIVINLPIPELGEVAQGDIGYISGDMAYQIKTALEQSIANEATARETDVTRLTTQISGTNTALATTNTNVANLTTQMDEANQSITQLQDNIGTTTESLDQNVQRDTTLTSDASTVVLAKVLGNLLDDTSETTNLPIPVASATQAGVINAATYKSLEELREVVEVILGGAVAVVGLPAAPTQEQLTSAWKTATGRDTLANGISILDTDNSKLWTYYANTTTWESSPAGGTIQEVGIATADTAGIVKSSTVNGQVAVEVNGTMSLNGYDAITTDVTNLKNTQTTQGAAISLAEENITNLQNTVGNIDTVLDRVNGEQPKENN